MLRLVKRMETIAQSDAAVVITGESGTGKELVARALHDGGGRRSKAFIAVNCAAFPDTLIEAELFGYERGAFTDATTRRDGRFKAAHGGTLFLDEVAELSQAAQAKLLRVLQEGTIEPLGSNETVKVDVRIVSATHRDLRARIADGLFREDLYYRINTLDIAIPPLRSRGGDLPVLVQHFIKRFSNPASADRRHHLAGLERAVGVCVSRQRAGADAHDPARGAAVDRRQDRFRAPSRGDPGRGSRVVRPQAAPMAPLGTAMKQFERAFLIRALAEFDDKKGKAAESLGISRKNLWEKLKMHGICASPDAETEARAARDDSPVAA